MKKLFKFLLALAAVAVIGYFGYDYFTKSETVVEPVIETTETPVEIVETVDSLTTEAATEVVAE